MKNYYEILGVGETATQDEIKKAYRKLSKQYHPDVNPQGEEKFKEVSEAYEHIGDETKRAEYENMRKNPFHGMGNGGFDMHSMFEQMMGMKGRQQAKAPDKVLDILLTPTESFFGVKKDIEYEVFEKCSPCDGSGGERTYCNTCGGKGVIIQIIGTGLFRQQIQMECSGCRGLGYVLSVKCVTCNGNGGVKQIEKLNVSIPKNVDNGDFMRMRNKGDYYSQIKMKGDVILKVIMDNNGIFEKIGMDLILKKKIDAFEFLTSDNIKVEHPDGDLLIKMPDSIDTDKPLRIPNKGFNFDNQKGNFFIKVSIKKDLTTKEKVKSFLEKTN
jgi:molecular chaperone DnaJ